MAKKDINNEPMLEENSDEVLLEETSGTETMLEETSDSEVLLEEDASESVLLEEDSEVLLEEATDQAAAISGIVGKVKRNAEEKAADEKRYKAAREQSRKEAEAERRRIAEEQERRRRAEAEARRNADAEAERKKAAQEQAQRRKAEAERRRSAAQNTQTSVSSNNNSIDLPFWGLAFAWGLPIAVVLMGWIYSFFDDDLHGLGYYLFLFLICAIPVNFYVARDEDLHKGQRKYFYIPLIILILIGGISIWWGISSLKNQPATKETYTNINERFYVKNRFVVDVNEGDTLLKPDGQGLCELLDGTMYERIKPKYDSIGYFAQSTDDVEMFIIKQDGKYGLVDKDGKELVEAKYTSIDTTAQMEITSDRTRLFKAINESGTDVYSYEPKFYGQMQ